MDEYEIYKEDTTPEQQSVYARGRYMVGKKNMIEPQVLYVGVCCYPIYAGRQSIHTILV